MNTIFEQLIIIICVCGSILLIGTISYIMYDKICNNNNFENGQNGDYTEISENEDSV
jgi:hypothetical protein